MTGENGRVCTACGDTKDGDAFYASSGNRCKECVKDQSRAWRAANRQRHRAQSKAWRQTNADAANAQGRVKTARRRQVGAPAAHTAARAAEALILLEQDDGICGVCGRDVDPLDFTVDHIYPLSRGGCHAVWNLQVAHRECNSRKHAGVI